jgi:uncharacterized protein
VTIRLRPHHLLCMLTYAGTGYSDAFCTNFDAIAVRLGAGEDILVVAGPDDVCAPVEALEGHHCHEASVVERDAKAAASVAALLGIRASEGARFALNAERLATLRSAFRVRTIRTACADCEWSALCDGIAESGYPGTRLSARA